MKKLFIIGNGFDLAHELPTSYDDFRKYLYQEYDINEYTQFIAPEGRMAPDGEILYNDNHVAGFLLYLISCVEGIKWCDLESAVGKLEYDELFGDLPVEYDRDGDYDDWKNVYIKQDFASNLVIPITKIRELFEDWVNTISVREIAKPIRAFMKLIDSEDYFLNFNYTRTLEDIYHIEEVCHIHGSQNEKIYFGHGDENDKVDLFQSKYIGAEDFLAEIHRSLKKNTSEALANHMDFFYSLSNNIGSVYSFGFSYSSVDEIYIKEICEKVDTRKVTWYFHDYDKESDREKYEITIRKCGFKGIVDTFHV